MPCLPQGKQLPAHATLHPLASLSAAATHALHGAQCVCTPLALPAHADPHLPGKTICHVNTLFLMLLTLRASVPTHTHLLQRVIEGVDGLHLPGKMICHVHIHMPRGRFTAPFSRPDVLNKLHHSHTHTPAPARRRGRRWTACPDGWSARPAAGCAGGPARST